MASKVHLFLRWRNLSKLAGGEERARGEGRFEDSGVGRMVMAPGRQQERRAKHSVILGQ